jgi:uncharacterized cupin superfamily protein
VLSGEVVLRTDAGEQVLKAGMCAGFPLGTDKEKGDGHQLVNRGAGPAVYLEMSNRDPLDEGCYPDVDLRWNAPDARATFTRRDGSKF